MYGDKSMVIKVKREEKKAHRLNASNPNKLLAGYVRHAREGQRFTS